jgi:LPS-assembly lipoprotein
MSLASLVRAASRPHLLRAGRFALAAALTLTLAACFQPMYGDYSVGNSNAPGLRDKLAAIDIPPIDVPNGSPVARIGVSVRNALSFKLVGNGGGAVAPTHKLIIKLTTTTTSVIVDINTGRPDTQNVGLDATYQLVELATGKVVLTSNTFARVSDDIPGQEQRFAQQRGLRDAQDRAAQVIADNIGQRLAAYFSAGT